VLLIRNKAYVQISLINSFFSHDVDFLRLKPVLSERRRRAVRNSALVAVRAIDAY
jgi:hypothetical protein